MGERGPPSSLAALPPGTRAEVDGMIAEGASAESVAAHLGARGIAASRSAVGRYAKPIRAALKSSRSTQAAMRDLVRSVDGRTAAERAHALVQLGQVVGVHAMAAASDPAAAPSPREVFELARAIAWLTQALRDAGELAPPDSGPKPGLQEALMRIRREIYGVQEPIDLGAR